jgi:hypothetical protein
LARTKEAKEARDAAQALEERSIWPAIKARAKSDALVAKAKLGRARYVWAHGLKEELLTRLTSGDPLASICRADYMPHISTVYEELQRSPPFADAYARARESMADTLLDECVDVADTLAATGDDDALNSFELQRAKLRIDTRLRVIGKISPKRYGDMLRTEVTGANGGPIALASVTIDARQLAPEQRETLRAALLATKNNNNNNVIEHDAHKPDED